MKRTRTSLIRIAGLLSMGLFVLVTGCKKDDHHHPPPMNEVDVEQIADGMVSPIGAVAVPDDSKRLFVIDQVGKIWIVPEGGNKLATPFLDLSSKLVSLSPNYDERGLIGFAFHPQYRQNGRFFVYYQLPPRAGGPNDSTQWNNLSRIAEFHVSASDPNMADMGSEKLLLEWDDPQSNHNGGTLAFGPDDGYLYISLGDGGAANDVAPGHVDDWYTVNAGGNGQDIEENLFGSILRIDVDNGSPYGIPGDNPFVNKTGMDEIYAYGFRNPFRMSFDMKGQHQLFVGDAGQALYEEISVVKKGGNYGWNVKEGTHCFNAADNTQELASCPDKDEFGNTLIDPVIELNNAANPKGGKATTIIGGNVYRGKAIPGLNGQYVFGTFSQSASTADGELFVAQPRGGNGLWDFTEIELASHPSDIGYYLKGFGQDNEGEIYLTVSEMLGPQGTSGRLLKLVPVSNKGN
jgi:glucose/arabinose dehydrogenase